MTCPQCGKPTIAGAKFCASCGSPLPQSNASASQSQQPDDGTVLSAVPHEPSNTPQTSTGTAPLPASGAAGTPQPAAASVPQPTAQPTQQFQYAPVPQPAQQVPAPSVSQVPLPTAQPMQPPQPSQPTQQFQYAPAPQQAPQPAPANQSQPTQQVARPAADPTITALTTPQSMKAMGASLGIGIGSAVVFALLASIVFFAGSSVAGSELSNVPGLSDGLSLLDNSGVHYAGPNFFQIIFTVLAFGVGGSLSLKSTSSGFSLSDVGIDASHVSVTGAVALPGMALAIGAAFGAYMLARRFALRFKWTGVISAGIVGLLNGLIVVILAAIFPMNASGSYSSYSASAAFTGASPRTFIMAFLLAGFGALAGYALAQYAADSSNVFTAAWRWAHRTRGFVRTLVESFAIYGALFLVLGVVATLVLSITGGAGVFGLLLVPLLFPALPFMLFSMSSFGGITYSAGMQQTLTLFNISAKVENSWILWICFVLFLVATLYIALRETARNMYDPYYAGWQHTWKAPVAVLTFWLVAEFLFTSFSAHYSSYGAAVMVPMWYFLVAGIWAFLIEVVAMTFGPTLVASLQGMWKLLVGGTVQQTPQNVVDYIKACDPHYGTKKTASAANSATTATVASMAPGMAAAPAAPQPAMQVPQPAVAPAPIPAAQPAFPAMANGSVPLPQQPGQPPVTAPGAGQPLDPKTKKAIVIGGIVVGALIVLGIVYGVLNSTVFSAKSVAQNYMSAIADGDYSKANGIADPQVDKNQVKLLSNNVAKTDNATISNPHVADVKTTAGVATVNVSYTLNGKTVNDSLTINKDGSKLLIFPNWKISSPLLKTINVVAPSTVDSLSVNGVKVSPKNAEKLDGNTWTLRVYPGTYKISAGKSDYITSDTVTVRTSGGSDSGSSNSEELIIKATSKLKEALTSAVNAKLDDCAKSTDYAPENCPFGFNLYDDDDYRNFAWSISSYPKITDIDLNNGTFSSARGKAKCTYEEKNSDDSWEPDDDSTTFSVNGGFSISNGKVKVTLDDSDY